MAKTRRHTPRTYTLEEKIALVTEIDRRYRAGGISLKAAAQAAGTTDTSYNNWRRAGIRPRAAEPPRSSTRVPRPYEPTERERLLSEVERLRAAGRSILDACREVGISTDSYRKWRDDSAPAPAMRPVEVMALVPAPSPALPEAATSRPVPSSALTLVAPGGYRIEGLGVEGAAALLRALL